MICLLFVSPPVKRRVRIDLQQQLRLRGDQRQHVEPDKVNAIGLFHARPAAAPLHLVLPGQGLAVEEIRRQSGRPDALAVVVVVCRPGPSWPGSGGQAAVAPQAALPKADRRAAAFGVVRRLPAAVALRRLRPGPRRLVGDGHRVRRTAQSAKDPAARTARRGPGNFIIESSSFSHFHFV